MATGFRLTDKNLLVLLPAEELTLRACILANCLEASIVTQRPQRVRAQT